MRQGQKWDIRGSSIPVDSTAILIIDMQNGFCHPRGSVASRLDITNHQAIIPNIRRIIEAARGVGIPICWTRQEHFPDDRGLGRHRLPTHLMKLGYVPCRARTWDAEIVDELRTVMSASDIVIVKHRASAFYNTTLELRLRMLGVDTLIVTGVSTTYCVDSTIRDAYARDFDIIAVRDACAAPWPNLHEATMENVALFHGEVGTTDEVVAALVPGAPTGQSRGNSRLGRV